MNANRMAAGAAMCCVVMFVGACGGGTSSPGAVPSPTTTAPGGGAGGRAGSGAGAFPGATGLLAQIDGTTLQVQGSGAQTAVTYSHATTFSNTVAGRLSNVMVGACVQVRSVRTASGTGGSAPSPAPSASIGPIAAASVEVSAAAKGGCSLLGRFRSPGTRPPGATGDATRPAGGPGGARGLGGGNAFGGLGAFGKVTAVNGASFTVESSRPQNSTATKAVRAPQTVKTSAATTFTRTGAASANALAVGLCITALGKTDDTGSTAATSIMLRPAVNGSCSSGFGRRGAGGSRTSPGGGSGA